MPRPSVKDGVLIKQHNEGISNPERFVHHISIDEQTVRLTLQKNSNTGVEY